MGENFDIEKKKKHKILLGILVMCLIGFLINILCPLLVRGLGLPLYLDNIGSSLTAALGGSLPGIIVGAASSLFNTIGNVDTVYYGCLTIMIAITSAFFARKGFYDFKKPWRLLAVTVVFALIGGGLGSVLTWSLYGLSFGSGVSAPLAQSILETGSFSPFISQLLADFILDLLDKAITVVIVTAVYQLIPKTTKKKLSMAAWRQTPLSENEKKEAIGRHSRGMPLRSKIVLVMSIAMVVIAAATILISYLYHIKFALDDQIEIANGIANVMADTVDADRIDEFLEKGKDAEGYLETEKSLHAISKSLDNISYVYVYQIREDGMHVVFDPDTTYTTGTEPGKVITLDESFSEYIPIFVQGGEIPPAISDGAYGWLLTVYKPIFDSQGVCRCYASVDINMTHIYIDGIQYLARMVSLFLGIFLMIMILSIWLTEYHVILPINTMEIATGQFAYDSENARTGTVERIEQLKIHTGDEIENLYHSIVKTTEDTVQYIEYTHQQAQALSKFQNGLILVLADMVESRDQCTGDHVRKTAAYTDIIMRQMKKEGIYTEQLTDEFVYEVFHSAPLHDVGKIAVSDLILNKPGKLTDEEFEIMKSHTTAGAEVIGQAMKEVSGDDSTYLKEAQNLAHYHHEKWNGTGYPEGLKGEEIPLAARIMAVADVFDALVSKRSYKDGFPFEKALSIIEEGAGSHFDPQVVKAFLDAKEEVRVVMEAQFDL